MTELLKSRYTAIVAFIVVNISNAWLTHYQVHNPAEWVGQALVAGASISLLLGKSVLTWKDDVPK